jgi:hypothetical protein
LHDGEAVSGRVLYVIGRNTYEVVRRPEGDGQILNVSTGTLTVPLPLESCSRVIGKLMELHVERDLKRPTPRRRISFHA